jgi:hypothetical protein
MHTDPLVLMGKTTKQMSRTPQNGGSSDFLAQRVESKRRDDRARFTGSSRNAVGGSPELRWKNFRGVTLQDSHEVRIDSKLVERYLTYVVLWRTRVRKDIN